MTFIDYLVLFVKYKKVLLSVILLTGIIGYLGIYFLIDEQYDSKSIIIPSKTDDMAGIGDLLGNLQNLPIGLGNVTNQEMGIYNTVIYSRTMLENIINKFDLIRVYKIDSSDPERMEIANKILFNNITTTETPDFAYELEVRAPNPKLSSDINKYLIQELNDKIVKLRIEKSRNNRFFLEERVKDIRNDLKHSEDTLAFYQEKSGLFEAEEQIKEILGVYGQLETELMTNQIELSILKQLLPSGNPQLEKAELSVNEYSKKLETLKKDGQKDGILLSMRSIPQKALDYYRNLRNVEINSKILAFILPLYEQAKFDEQKDVPVLQVVDLPVPPVKKSYPPRAVFTLVLMFAAFLICFFVILISENENWQKSEKFLYVKKNLFRWK
jgi:capsule polysaccharide export protein KpsE/RkpR